MFRNVTTTLSQMKSYNEWIIFTNNTAVRYSSDLTQSSPFVSFGRLSFKVSSWTSPCLHLPNLVSRRPHCGNQGSIWMCHAAELLVSEGAHEFFGALAEWQSVMKSGPFVGSSRKCSAKIWTLARKNVSLSWGRKIQSFYDIVSKLSCH